MRSAHAIFFAEGFGDKPPPISSIDASAEGRTRTVTGSPPLDFESSASTNFTTSASYFSIGYVICNNPCIIFWITFQSLYLVILSAKSKSSRAANFFLKNKFCPHRADECRNVNVRGLPFATDESIGKPARLRCETAPGKS